MKQITMRTLVLIGMLSALVPISWPQTLKTPGAFNVSQNGEATYTIPIFAPRGPGGVQPNISLTYNSASGYGYLGVGWALSGLGSIERCNLTPAQDGVAASSTGTYADRFCLNGKRLQLTSSENLSTYGQAGTTYQTEIADFSVITAVGTSGYGPAYFTVAIKNGWTYEYGNPANSSGAQVTVITYVFPGYAQATSALSWKLDKVTDPSGNTMTITYQPPSATLQYTTVPQKISWTPSSYASTSYNNTMTFSYTTSATPTASGYVSGTAIYATALMNGIQVATNGIVIKTYVLNYGTSAATNRQTLQSVKECADAGATNCLSPTTVTYQTAASGTSFTATGTLAANNNVDTTHDFNGDGIPDLFYTDGTGDHVRFGTLSGYSSTVVNVGTYSEAIVDLKSTGQDGLLLRQANVWWYYAWNGSNFVGASTNSTGPPVANKVYSVDVNGDGLPDIIYYTFSTQLVGNYTLGNVQVYAQLNTGSASAPSFGSPVQIYSEISEFLRNVAVIVNPAYTAPGGRRGLDFNGDGHNDIVLQRALTKAPTCSVNCVTSIETRLLFYTGTSYTSVPILVQDGTDLPQFLPIDFNGDRCTDFVSRSTLVISACNGQAAATVTLTAVVPNTNPAIVVETPVVAALDWDGDGLVDIAYQAHPNDSTISIVLAAPTITSPAGLGNIISTGIPYSALTNYVRLDANGDGLDDLGLIGTSLTYYLHNSAASPPDLLTSITDGYGNFSKPTYVPITQSNYTQTPSLTPTFPYRPYRGPQYVVSQAIFNDPTSTATPTGTYYQSFTYADEWMSLTGRGLTGMRSKQVFDSRSTLWTTSVAGSPTVGQAFPFTGAPYQTIVAQDRNNTLPVRSVTNTAVQDTLLDNTANNQRHFPHSVTEVEQVYEVGAPKNGQLLKTITINNTSVDTHGTNTAASVVTQDNDAGSPYNNQTWTTTINKTPYYDTTSCGVLFSQVQVAYTASNAGPAVTRTKQMTPDTAHCRYAQIVTEPASTTYKVTEALGYDSFGNVSSDVVTGANMTASPATRSTNANWGTTGQFLSMRQDPSGAMTTATYASTLSAGFGVPDSVTDSNGIKATFAYDAFGRKTQAQLYDSAGVRGSGTNWSYTLCSGCDVLPRMIVRESPIDNAGIVITARNSWFDMLDRKFRTQDTQLDGSIVWSQFDALDSLGRVTTSAFPYVQGNAVWNVNFHYDLINRTTLISRPTSASNNTAVNTTVSYQGDTVIKADALTHATTTVWAADGQVHQTIDANGYAVLFGYDAARTVIATTDSVGNALWSATIAYGLAPFKTASADTDLGAWSYTVDALGEIIGWKDAKGQSFSATYDALSRRVTRAEPDNAATWVYGTSAAAHNVGQLQCVLAFSGSSCASTGTGYREDNVYDSLARLQTRTITEDIPYALDYTYNAQGLLNTLVYPASTSGCRVAVHYGYQNGLLKSLTDASNTTACGAANGTLWQANTVGPRGQVTQETLGNGIVSQHAYDGVTGLPSSMQAGLGGGAAVQNESYLYDTVGNMTQRQDNNAGLTESFFYDGVNRLDHSTLGAVTNLQMHYDGLGNIISRSDVAAGAAWTYDPVRKHAVLQAGNTSTAYSYDANGNAVTRSGSVIGWTSFNYPNVLNGPGKSAVFSYTPDRSHFQQIYTSAGASTETTMYVGGLLEKVTMGTASDWRHYIRVGNESIAVIARSSSGTNAIRYILSDPLGSLTKITDSVGTPYVAESYCPYGARRDATTWSGSPSCPDLGKMKLFSREGFTGQDMIGGNSMNLIHMNGRVEDAITGRFLSADPYVSEPGNTQSYNRYSYTYNNPLSYTDPTGFESCYNYTTADGNPANPDDTRISVNTFTHCVPDTLEEIVVTALRQSNDCDQTGNCGQDPYELSVYFSSTTRQPDTGRRNVEYVPTPQIIPCKVGVNCVVLQTQDPRCNQKLPDGSTVTRNVRNLAQSFGMEKMFGGSGLGTLFNWFANVAPGGSQDYKLTRQPGSEAMGNFNFGATGNVFFRSSPTFLKSGAGIVQLLTYPKGSDGGIPFILPPYGDAKDDQQNIDAGINGGC